MKTLPALILAISFALSVTAETRSVLERGPHHAVYPPSDGSPDGAPTLVLETGLHYWSPETKEWLPADPSLPMNATGDAFVAHKTLGQLRASAQINTVGAITVNLDPQDPTRQLVTTPVAIALEEPATGRMLIVGTITNSLGSLVEGTTNQIIYEDCFAGVCASYVVEVQRGTYSADVVFTGQFDVRDWGFTTNARVQIISEIYGPPPDSSIRRPLYIEQDPQKIAQAARLGLSLDVIDETLGWGNLVMAEGSAYTAPTPTAANGASVPVAKEVQTADGRLFLVESLAFASLQSQFLRLPECNPRGGHARLDRPEDAKLRYAAIPRLPSSPIASVQPSSAPAVPSPTPKTSLPLQARIAHRPTGVYVDYIANLGGTLTNAITFQSSTNVLITGSLILNGAVTIEPIIVKYKANAYMQINNTLTLKNFGQFRGAQFTCVDDNSVGDTCAGITNSGYTGVITNTGYANPAIYTAQSSLSLTNCRFFYAKLAVQCVPPLASSSTYTFSHSQLVNCITGIQLGAVGCGSWGCGVTVGLNANNCLMANVKVPFNICVTNPPSLGLKLANCTLDRATQIAQRASGSLGLNATNCIFANITNTSAGVTFTGAYNGFYRSAQQFGAAQSTVTNSPFQSAGAGNYYLTAASGFANAGTNSVIPAWLQADLGKRTIYPPTVVCNVLLTNDQVLSPQAQRDTSACSLGMHYDPIDWALGWVLITNATITVNTGTVIAAFGTNAGGGNIGAYGLAIGQNAALQCQGAPTTPNWFVAYNSVQEQGTNSGGWLPPSSGLLLSEFQGLNPGSVINCRFTRCSVPSLDEPGFNALTNSGPLTFQDCEFHGGKLLSSRPTIDLANCLLERVYANLSSADGNSPYIRNCLFLGGIFNFAPNVTNALVKDNLFDQTSIPTNTSIYTTYNGGYNGYVTNKDRLLPWFATDKILTATLAYQTGPLGSFYYPTNGPSGGLTNLFNTGSTWATNVGLYDYTTTTNQVVEGSTILDSGYHYVAVDASGNPLDLDSDAVPDYLEDAQWNDLPDFWQWYWFGNCNHTASELDAKGNTLLYDYSNGLDPNIIMFTLSATNCYVTQTTVPLQISVSAGTPSFYAVLVNDTNTANANWQRFISTNLSVMTPTDGVYVVSVGLCGPAPTASRTWQTITLFRDTTPLGLVLTNLPTLSGSRPFIDPAGYTTRAVSSLTWTLIDANGNTNSGNGAVVAQGWSLFDPFHTTSWFQCVDLALAPGTNWVAIRAVDWVGSVAVTNFAYIFDTNGDSTPPSLTLLWPQDGSHLSGDSFTVQAWTDDDTAAVALQYTDANGILQTVNGSVERGGAVWAPGVPLAAGTNLFSLIATDAAGNMTTNNFSAVQNSVDLTVTPLSQRLMQYCSAPVSVTVGAPAAAVTVNGLPGTSADGLYWTVESVPLPPGGTVTLQATAQLNDGTTLKTLLKQERDPIVFTQTFGFKLDYSDVFDATGKVALVP